MNAIAFGWTSSSKMCSGGLIRRGAHKRTLATFAILRRLSGFVLRLEAQAGKRVILRIQQPMIHNIWTQKRPFRASGVRSYFAEKCLVET